MNPNVAPMTKRILRTRNIMRIEFLAGVTLVFFKLNPKAAMQTNHAKSKNPPLDHPIGTNSPIIIMDR